MCVLTFSTILSETFLILRRIKRDMTINVYRFSRKVPVFTLRLKINLNYLDVFSRITLMKLHENPPNGSWVVPYRQTDRQTWQSKWSLFAILWTRLKGDEVFCEPVRLSWSISHMHKQTYVLFSKALVWLVQWLGWGLGGPRFESRLAEEIFLLHIIEPGCGTNRLSPPPPTPPSISIIVFSRNKSPGGTSN